MSALNVNDGLLQLQSKFTYLVIEWIDISKTKKKMFRHPELARRFKEALGLLTEQDKIAKRTREREKRKQRCRYCSEVKFIF